MKEFKAESKRLLDLMINSIYTNKEIFLRELISNASDAIDKRHFLSLTDAKAATDLKITVSVNKPDRTIKICDNGVGMTGSEMEDNLSTIAKSGTLAFKKENENAKDLIGQFGVGFYSAFLVASEVSVISKKLDSADANKWYSRGAEGYTIESAVKADAGTEITLKLKEKDEDYNYDTLLEEYKIEELIKKYSDYIRYPIMLGDKVINTQTPIWKRQKGKVKKEEYNDFYLKTFKEYMPPLKTIYANMEGTTSYTTLLFIPSKRPFDFLTRDYKKGLTLYSDGVMIMEKCDELLPEYLGFIKGLVDTSDLPLNISREILQSGRQIKAIAASLEKKILSEFSKMLKSDKERSDYEKMFEQFGQSIKFGAYDNFGAKKDSLKDLLIFKSSFKDTATTTLKEYVSRMKEGQDTIYYACGEEINQIAKMPKTMSRINAGHEVLFLTDKIDEFVMKTLTEYDKKKILSVNESHINDVATEEQQQEVKAKEAEYKDLIAHIGEVLKDRVKTVKLSSALLEHAVNLTSEGQVTLEMEKVFAQMPDSPGMKAEKILEFNPSHAVFEKMNNLLNTDKERLGDYINLLYTTALMQEGFEIKDNVEFATLLQKLI